MNPCARTILVAAAMLAAATANAATLTLSNAGALTGVADETVGWGFTITSTEVPDGKLQITPWLMISSVSFLPNPGQTDIGVFEAYLTEPPNSDTVIGTPAGHQEVNPWTQSFSQGLRTGIGEYHINSFQSPGDQVFGKIQILFDMYRVSPNDPSFNPDTDTLANGQVMEADASVQIPGLEVTTAPEPGSQVWLGLATLGALAARRRRLRRRA